MDSDIVNLILLGAPLAILFVISLWKICRRAGFHPFFSLFALAPFGFFVAAAILAFAKWPAFENLATDQRKS